MRIDLGVNVLSGQQRCIPRPRFFGPGFWNCVESLAAGVLVCAFMYGAIVWLPLFVAGTKHRICEPTTISAHR